jgi:hypothetical protein
MEGATSMKEHPLYDQGLVYVATPYAACPDGIDRACINAAEVTARLLLAGCTVFSPVCHTHPIAVHGAIPPTSHDIWLPFDKAMIDRCDAVVVVTFDGWNVSKGIAFEIEEFRKAGKRVFFMDPISLVLEGVTS